VHDAMVKFGQRSRRQQMKGFIKITGTKFLDKFETEVQKLAFHTT
jgi:hypothetical protein